MSASTMHAARHRPAPATPASAPRQTLVIRDAAALHDWRRQVRFVGRMRNTPPVLFQFSQLPPERNLGMSALAREYQQACGCASASLFMSVGVAAMIAWFFATGGQLAGLSPVHVLALGGVAVLSALTGKLLGLVWARWQLIQIADDIGAMISGAR